MLGHSQLRGRRLDDMNNTETDLVRLEPTAHSVGRRGFFTFGGLGLALTAVGCASDGGSTPDSSESSSPAALGSLERSSGITMGVYAEDIETGRVIAHRDTERFPMCSLFKTLVVGALLASKSPYKDYWSKEVAFSPDQVVENSPILSAADGGTMSISALADAALRFSDNTAGNLLLREIGGPPGIGDFARSIGAKNTRLDRWEPHLNEALPGDERDTSTPADIGLLYRKLLIDDTLGMLGQARLRDWMLRNTTSDKRIRAAIDGDFELADKTGAGAYGVVNDAGILWRPDGSATVLTVLTRTDDPSASNDDEVVVEATRIILEELSK